MNMDKNMVAYLTAVVIALDTNTISEGQTSADCAECMQTITNRWDQEHIVWVGDNDRLVVIVGCEGYWQVSPHLVGIPSETWQSVQWDKLDSVMDDLGIVDDRRARRAAMLSMISAQWELTRGLPVDTASLKMMTDADAERVISQLLIDYNGNLDLIRRILLSTD